MDLNEIKILRFKSDNCSCQYKCKYVFYFWQPLAKEHNKNIIYQGVSGHGKNQADVMSGFGVKSPLREAIVIKAFFYTTRKFLITYQKILYVNLEYIGMWKP